MYNYFVHMKEGNMSQIPLTMSMSWFTEIPSVTVTLSSFLSAGRRRLSYPSNNSRNKVNSSRSGDMLIIPVVEERCREDGVEVACGGFPVVAFNICRLGLKSLPAMCKSINLLSPKVLKTIFYLSNIKREFPQIKSVKNYLLSNSSSFLI